MFVCPHPTSGVIAKANKASRRPSGWWNLLIIKYGSVCCIFVFITLGFNRRRLASGHYALLRSLIMCRKDTGFFDRLYGLFQDIHLRVAADGTAVAAAVDVAMDGDATLEIDGSVARDTAFLSAAIDIVRHGSGAIKGERGVT